MSIGGVYRGVVQAIDGPRVRITITRLGGSNIYVARLVLPIGAPDAGLGATSLDVGDDTVPLRPLQAGDEVLVAFLEGNRDEPVILGRMA